MRFLLISLFVLCATAVTMAAVPTSANQTTEREKVRQRFNPIFGNEKESNDIISFIASNLVVELEQEQLKRIDGVAVISFIIDTAGNIDRLDVVRSIRPWIDYELIGAIKRLPQWGTPHLRSGKPVEKRHQIVFTFGTYIKKEYFYGFQPDLVRNNTQKEIDQQRAEYQKQLAQHYGKWNSFTTKNAKLEYDTKNGLRNESQTLMSPQDMLKANDLPAATPTIKITGTEN